MLWPKTLLLCDRPPSCWEDALLGKGRALYPSYHAPEDTGVLIWHPEVLLPLGTLRPRSSAAGH